MPADGFVQNGDVRIATRDYGGRERDVLLLHGGGRNLCDWELCVPALTSHHRAVGMDVRGHGLSDEPEVWSWDDVVSDMERVGESLLLENPFVVGHSMGGMAAAYYGAAHRRSPGVVNVDGHGGGGPSLPAEVEDFLVKAREGFVPPPDSGDEAWLEAQLAPMRAGAERMGIPPERAEPALRRSYALGDDGVYHRRPSTRFMQTFPPMRDLFDVYLTVECLFLIVNCTRTTGSGLPDALAQAYRDSIAKDLEALAADGPNVRIATVDAGHMVLLENPARLAQELLSFACL